jgi:hypothetical protein
VLWRGAVLAGAATSSLEGHDAAAVEYLTTPDAEWFLPIDRTDQTDRPSRAVGTQHLRKLEVGWVVSEPKVGTMHLTR